MAAETPRFHFVCGSDEFLVGRVARERFEFLAADAADEFSREIVDGRANNVGEVETAVNRFREAVQTLPLFGGRRVVWLKDITFLADTPTGRAEGTLVQLDALKELLATVDPAAVGVLVTAAPVDRRRAFFKWCEAHSEFAFLGGDAHGDTATLERVALAEAAEQRVTLTPPALALLVAKLQGNTRLLVEEVRKLAAFVGTENGAIEESHVAELTPNFGEGDFFEAAEAFFAGDLKWTLDALRRHFFAGGDARPVLSSLQNRNRLLLQIKMLVDAGELRFGPRGIDKAGFERAAATYAHHYGGVSEKSTCHLFTQNIWYLGKLAGTAKVPSMRRLIDWQQEFFAAFQALLDRPQEGEEVLRELAIRCLTPTA
jgi:DNA polymerase-3 subunit delta